MPDEPRSTIYILDTSALRNIHSRSPQAFRKLKPYCRDGVVRVPSAVIREVQHGKDKLKNLLPQWAKKYVSFEIGDTDPAFKAYITEIMRNYGGEFRVGNYKSRGLSEGRDKRHGADVQVVAAAKFIKTKGKDIAVVSDDKGIKDACMLENLVCISWQEFIRRLGLSRLFQGQQQSRQRTLLD